MLIIGPSKLGNWFILEFIVINIKPHYFTNLINSLFDEFYDKRGRAIINQTVMDKYKNQQRPNDNMNFPSTSYGQDNYFDLPPNTNYNNQFTSAPTFGQGRSSFLGPSSPTSDFAIPSIIASSKIATTTARRPKKKQIRTSLSSSLAAKTVTDSFSRPDWDNQSNQETAPFLNEMPELDLEGPAFPSASTLTGDRKIIKQRDFKRLSASRERRDKPSSAFGATANESSLTDTVFEAFPMNQSDDEWK